MTSSSTEMMIEVAERLCADAVISVERCGRGGNNRVYRVQTASAVYAMKAYGSLDVDDRDRLGHEYEGLRFLETAGTGKATPAAIAVERAARCALYEWIDGAPPADHGAADIISVLELLAILHGARDRDGASKLPTATEAVLQLSDLLEQIDRRMTRLGEVAPSERELAAFLDAELRPELERRIGALKGRAQSVELDARWRTLSPSDFGFHNALRKADGSLIFIDFEYFGWDDPVKVAADFLWHPAMQLSGEQRSQFLDGVLDLYKDDPDFHSRLGAYFPLYGIRWCLIILNEFLPGSWARRTFSGGGRDWSAAKREQLFKARAMLAAVRSYEEGHFIS